MTTKHKKDTGQYFTISEDLQKFVFEKVKYKSNLLLEPSFGAGHLLKKFKDYDDNYPIICYELDKNVKPIVSFNQNQTPIYADFTQQPITTKFKTIIGNPPYVKQKTGNLYIKFIELCWDYLDDGGELIFIVPSDFIKLTSATTILNKMMENGSFTDILFPRDEKLFEGASIDVMVFRYEKGMHSKTTIVNDQTMICNVNNGIITFSDREMRGTHLSTKFDTYVGLVSGRDEIFRVKFGNLDILTDKDKVDNFIFIESFPSENGVINDHLLANKASLLERRIRKFGEANWFEWGAPRNIGNIRRNFGKPCIFVRNMTRNQEVAFVGRVQYFGGTLLCLVPKEPMTETELQTVASFLNSRELQRDYIYSGRFKIGQKQVCNITLPHQ